jgi:hypothetical protein
MPRNRKSIPLQPVKFMCINIALLARLPEANDQYIFIIPEKSVQMGSIFSRVSGSVKNIRTIRRTCSKKADIGIICRFTPFVRNILIK